MADPARRASLTWPTRLSRRVGLRIVTLLRSIPIRWRILSIAGLNAAVVVVLTIMIWSSAKVLDQAWVDVRQARASERALASLENQTSRLQNLIHRYVDKPTPEVFDEIMQVRKAALGTLTRRALRDPMLSGSIAKFRQTTARLLGGFRELRRLRATIATTYQEQVLAPAKDMAGLFSTIEGATGHRDAPIWPAVGRSRDAFTAMLVAINSYYLSHASASAEEARRNTETIEKTIPEISGLADNDLQRRALERLKARTVTLQNGLGRLSEEFSRRTDILRNTIDAARRTQAAKSTNCLQECASTSARPR